MNVMLYVGGHHSAFGCSCGREDEHRSFRCDNRVEGELCGANVFTKLSEHRWRCNACGATYTDVDASTK